MVSVEVPLSCKIGLRDLLSRKIQRSDLTGVTPELLILKSDEAPGIKRLPVFVILASQLLKMTAEQMEMEGTSNTIFLPEIIYKNEMMCCIGHLPEKVIPVPPHARKVKEQLFRAPWLRCLSTHKTQPKAINEEQMSDLMGDRLRSLVVLERICNLYNGLSPGKTHCCRRTPSSFTRYNLKLDPLRPG
jgi:hypothetical protein